MKAKVFAISGAWMIFCSQPQFAHSKPLESPQLEIPRLEIPMYDGQMIASACAYQSFERIPPEEFAIKLRLMKNKAAGLIRRAAQKTDSELREECHYLHKGSLKKTPEDLSALLGVDYCKLFNKTENCYSQGPGYCEFNHEANGCYSMRCFGYAQANCLVF